MLSLFCEWGNRAAWIAAAIIAVLFFYAVIYAFPNARQVAMQQRDAIERENRAFCEKCGRLFGIREHTPYLHRTWRTSGPMNVSVPSITWEFSNAVLRPDPRRAKFSCDFSGSD